MFIIGEAVLFRGNPPGIPGMVKLPFLPIFPVVFMWTPEIGGLIG